MAQPNPNPTAREGLFNANRHKHKLLLFEKGLPVYKCSGCKEYGADRGYRCKIYSGSKCVNFTLHEDCGALPDAFEHPYRKGVILKFRPKTLLPHDCSACCNSLKGFVFETEKCHIRRHIRLHPLCMKLPPTLEYGGHPNHKLKILTGDLKEQPYTCSPCNRYIGDGGWRYQCEDAACKYYVDPRCAKNHHFRLPDHGIQRPSGGKTKTLAVFCKPIISGAVMIGEAIFGEVVGEIFPSQPSEEP